MERYRKITTLIVLLAFSLRLFGLDSNSLWVDELFTLKGSQFSSVSELLSWLYSSEYSDGVGFYIVEWFSFRVPGLSTEGSLRLAPLIFSISTVPFIGLLAKRFFDNKTAIYAMLFFSVSMTQIYFAQEARPYSGIVFFSTINTFLWLEMILPREESWSKRFLLWGYIVSSTLGCYFDFAVILFTLAHFASAPFLVGFNLEKMKIQTSASGAILLLFSPGIYRFIGALRSRPNYMEQPQIYFFRDYQVMHFNGWEFFFWVAILLYFYYFCRCIFSIEWEKTVSENARRFTPELFFAIWLAIPAIVLVLYSWATEPVINSKRLLFTSPASYVLLSKASLEFGNNFRRADIIPVLLVSALLTHTIIVSEYYSENNKQPIREGIELLNENYDGESVYAFPDSHFFSSYYDSIIEDQSMEYQPIRWHGSSQNTEDFVGTIKGEGSGWILVADNNNDPFEIDKLLLDIGPEASIVEEFYWSHTDPFNEGWENVRLLRISIVDY